MTEERRVALVSGGNRGIGREIVRQLAEKGITVIMGSRDEEAGRAAAEGIEGDVHVRQLDVTDEKSIQRLAESIESEFGRLDILVNNAGISNDRGQQGVDADPTVFVYDGYPGGVGISKRGYDAFESLARDTVGVITRCPCERGCPACIQSPKCGNWNEPLSKDGAVSYLRYLLGQTSRYPTL